MVSLRKNPVAWAALFIALGGTSYAATQQSAPPGCYPKGSTTIAQDKAGRFYFSGVGRNRQWYVCAFKEGTPHPAVAAPQYDQPTVSGRYLAFFHICRCIQGQGQVTVIDMVTGRRTFSERPSEGNEDLVLKPDGSVAWITSRFKPPISEVIRHDSTGTTVLTQGPGIDPYSLAAGGSWLYWTNDGSPRSAPFH